MTEAEIRVLWGLLSREDRERVKQVMAVASQTWRPLAPPLRGATVLAAMEVEMVAERFALRRRYPRLAV